MDALEKTREYTEGSPDAEVVKEEQVAAKNAMAVTQLDAMMRGLR